MNIGALIVQMNAESKALAKGLQEGLSAVERTAREMKKLGREVAQVGLGITAFFGTMLKAAAGVDYGVKKQLDALKDSFLTLAVQVARMVLPAVQQLTQFLRELAGWFNGLSPHAKKMVGDFAMLALQVGAAAVVFSKLMAAGQALAGVLSAVAGVIAALGAGGLALLLGGLVALVAIVALLHKAWRTNWHGIRDVTKNVIETLSGWWSKFADFMSGIWSAIVDDVATKARALVDVFVGIMKLVGKGELGSMLGTAAHAAIGAAADTAKSPMAMKKLALAGLEAVKEAGLDLAKELKLIVKEVKGALGLGGGGSAPGYSSSKVGQGGAMEPYSKATMDAIDRSLNKAQRVGGASAARGSGLGAVSIAMNYDQLQEQYTKDLMEAWDAADWGGMFEAVGSKIWESLTNLEAIGGALKVAGNTLLSKLGDLGQVISSGIQGFQSGGIWGALIAVILEIISRFKRWQEILDVGNGQLQIAINEMQSGFSSLIDGFKSIMGGIGMIAHVVHQVLNPILEFIGKLFGELAGVLALVAIAIEPIGQIFSVLGPMLNLMMMTMKPIFELISVVMRGVGLAILGSMWLVAQIWNGIMTVLWNILVGLGLDDAAKEVSKAFMDTNSIESQMKALANGNMKDLADSSAAAAESVGKMGNSADRVTEQLLNVPEGFKVALEQFNAIATSSTGGAATVFSYDAWQRAAERQSYRNTGNPSGSGTNSRTKRDSEI